MSFGGLSQYLSIDVVYNIGRQGNDMKLVLVDSNGEEGEVR